MMKAYESRRGQRGSNDAVRSWRVEQGSSRLADVRKRSAEVVEAWRGQGKINRGQERWRRS